MNNLLGIEINKRYLKLALINSQGKNSKDFDCVVETISSLNDEQITQKIIEIVQREKLKSKSAMICLPRDFVTVRNLQLPSNNLQEITQMIDLYIARLVPYKKDEIVFSHRMFGTDEMGYAKIILAVVQIETIRRQIKIIEKAGLSIDNINLSSYGLYHWVIKNQKAGINLNNLYLLLDIDTQFTDFIILSKEGLVFTRSIDVGAEAIKANSDTGMTRLLGEAKQALIIFYKEGISKEPAGIFLSGVTDIIAGLDTILGTEFGVPVKTISSPHNIEALKSKKRNIPADISLNALTGLLLEDSGKSLAFTLPEIEIRKSVREKAKDLMILGSLLVCILSLAGAIFMGSLYNRQRYLRFLQQGYTNVEKDIGDVINQLKNIEFIRDYLAARRMPLFILYHLHKIIPGEIAIDVFTINEDESITISGQALGLTDVSKFISHLEKTAVFKDIHTDYMRMKKIKDKEIADFKLNFQTDRK